MPTLGVAVVVYDGMRVLLTQREDFRNWCLLGGAIDDYESADEAAMREVYEETGLTIHLTHFVGMTSRPFWERGGSHILVFAGVPLTTTFTPQASEVVDLGFFAPDALPSPLFLEHRQYIVDALAQTCGHLWVNMLRPPAQFASRAALYHWRDTLGVPREQAYTQLMQVCGPQQLECRLGPAQGRIIQEEGKSDALGDGDCDGF